MLYNSRHLDELVIVMKYAIPHQAHHGRFDVRSRRNIQRIRPDAGTPGCDYLARPLRHLRLKSRAGELL